MQVSSIRQEHHQPSTAEASTSHSRHPATAAAGKQQVHIKLPNSSKSTIPADMVLWTAGSSPASHAARKLKLPFKTNKQGALLTDRNLRVVQQQRVFALGDVAGSEIEAQTANIPPTAQVYMGVLHRHFCVTVALSLLHCHIACGCFCCTFLRADSQLCMCMLMLTGRDVLDLRVFELAAGQVTKKQQCY